MESEGRRLHGLAAQARERGEPLEALKLSDEAALAYQKDGDILGFAENLVDRSITLRHLADSTRDSNYLIVALHESLAAVEIARKSGREDALAIPLEKLAVVQEELELLEDAVKSYREAVENIESNPPAEHKVPERPAIVADFKLHLATCEYKAGDKSALERAEAALSDLEAHPDIADYNQHVWVSGGHMRIAEMLREDDPEKAKKHLQKAKEVIDSDPRLTIRLSQWQQLAEKFK